MPKLFQASLKQGVYPIELFGGGPNRTREQNEAALERARREGKPIRYDGLSKGLTLADAASWPRPDKTDLRLFVDVDPNATAEERWAAFRGAWDFIGECRADNRIKVVPRLPEGASKLITIQPPLMRNPSVVGDREPYIRYGGKDALFISGGDSPTFLQAVQVRCAKANPAATSSDPDFGLWNIECDLDPAGDPLDAGVVVGCSVGLQNFQGDGVDNIDAEAFNGIVRIESISPGRRTFGFKIWMKRLDPTAVSSDDETPLYQLPAVINLIADEAAGENDDDRNANKVVVYPFSIVHLGGMNGLTTECAFGAWYGGRVILENIGLELYNPGQELGCLLGIKKGGEIELRDYAGVLGSSGERAIRGDDRSKLRSNRANISPGVYGAVEAVVMQYGAHWQSTRDCVGLAKKILCYAGPGCEWTLDQGFFSVGTEGVRVDGAEVSTLNSRFSHFTRGEFVVQGRLTNAGRRDDARPGTVISTCYNAIDWRSGGFVWNEPTFRNNTVTPLVDTRVNGGGLYSSSTSDLRDPGRTFSVGQYGGRIELPLLVGAGLLTIQGRTIHEANIELDVDPFSPLDYPVRPRVATMGPLARFEHNTTLARKTGDAVGFITYASHQRSVNVIGAHITRKNGVTTIQGGAMVGHPFVRGEAVTVAGSTVESSARGGFRLISVTADSISYEQPGEADIPAPVGTNFTVSSWRLQVQSDREFTHAFRAVPRGDLDVGAPVQVTAAGSHASEPVPSRSPRQSGRYLDGEILVTKDFAADGAAASYAVTDLGQFRELIVEFEGITHDDAVTSRLIKIELGAGGVYRTSGYVMAGSALTDAFNLSGTHASTNKLWGTAFITDFNQADKKTRMRASAGLEASSTTYFRQGRYDTAAEAHDCIRFTPSAGNIAASGRILIRGKRHF